MMKSKFKKMGAIVLKWFPGVLLFFSLLYSVNSNAQLVSADHRDSSLSLVSYSRAQILAMDNHQQTTLFEDGGFLISDLINASFEDFMTATPDQVFIIPNDFYQAPWQKQQMYILNPDKYKIYKPSGH